MSFHVQHRFDPPSRSFVWYHTAAMVAGCTQRSTAVVLVLSSGLATTKLWRGAMLYLLCF